MIVFEILWFCRTTFQFSVFSYVILRFSLLTIPVHVVRKTLVKHVRISKTEKLYDKISKSQILSFTIWNTPLTLHAHQISARSEHYTWCTGERNFVLEKTYDFPHLLRSQCTGDAAPAPAVAWAGSSRGGQRWGLLSGCWVSFLQLLAAPSSRGHGGIRGLWGGSDRGLGELARASGKCKR